MRQAGFSAFLVIVSFVLPLSLAASPVPVGDLKDGLLLGPQLKIFEDKAGTARWADVLAGKHDADFKAQNKLVPNFGSTRSVIWAVVDLEFAPPPAPPLVRGGEKEHSSPKLGGGREGADYLLELSHPVLDFVDVVVLDVAAKKILNRWETGDLRPFDSRPVNHRNFLFPLTAASFPIFGIDSATPTLPSPSGDPLRVSVLGEGPGVRLLLKLASESTMQIPLKIWLKDEYYRADGSELMFLGIFYGIMLVMIIYNLAIAFAMRTLSGYFYATYLTFITITQLTLDGLFYQIFPYSGFLNNLGIIFWGSLAYLFFAQFSRQYFSIRSSERISFWLLTFISVTCLIGFLIGLVFGYRAGFLFVNPLLGMISPAILIFIVISRYKTQRRLATFFGLGFLFLLLGLVSFALMRRGILESSNPLAYHSLQIGSALEAILLSFGLADRIRLIQKEKELAQTATIEQQRILNDAFARFVPTPFLQFLGKKSIPEVLLGDYTEREMTILFADIRGFTTISEKLSPKQTFDFINSYLQGSGPVIRNNGGFIDKYMGDGIMALFERREDAIKAALRLQERNARLNRMLSPNPNSREESESTPPPDLGEVGRGRGLIAPLNVGIGIHTGHLMLGTIGEHQRMDGTVISDAVNLASRVESLTKQYGVNLLVTKETIKGMHLGTPEFPYLRRFIDRIAVKGKTEPATVYELIAMKNGKPTRYSERWLDGWSQALKLYYAREFDSAAKIFEELSIDQSQDRTLAIFRERCDSLSKRQPPEDWNGVAIAESK